MTFGLTLPKALGHKGLTAVFAAYSCKDTGMSHPCHAMSRDVTPMSQCHTDVTPILRYR